MDTSNNSVQEARPRIREIDSLRGVAVIAMVIYHAAFDVDFFGITNIDLAALPWNALARLAQILFISLAGVTLTLAIENDRKPGGQSITRRMQHALKLFLLAMVISAVTYFSFGELGVKFGILHFLSIAIFLSPAFVKLGAWIILPGLAIIGIGTAIPLPDDPWWLFPLGIRSATFRSLDYFPLVPWYGVFLLGMGLARAWLARNGMQEYRPRLRCPPLERLGRHSLAIYLIHQPVLAGVIILFRQ